MFQRDLSKKILELARGFPVVAVTGPRQSGKTTLVKELFSETHAYVSLEDLDMREFASSDPRGFLEHYNKNTIFDEIQHVPSLFSYIQGIVDEVQKPGQFILTGSQHFLLYEKITQSLAGRVGMLHLLPLSLSEIKKAHRDLTNLEEVLHRGFYPSLFVKDIQTGDWYRNYVRTYVERDLRLIKNIHDLGTFQNFLKMCAARTGQILDMTSIGNDCGVTHNTVKGWLNILEASFIIYVLRPHFKNFNKRMIKSPKIYFYDTGLLCYLLDIKSADQLKTHYLRGGIFESFVITELMKELLNSGKDPSLYFWRDQHQHEIDCLLDLGMEQIPIEIKSSQTIAADFFDGLKYWNELANGSPQKSYLIYGGDQNQKRTAGTVLGWRDIKDCLDENY